jgi:hypothetical protein
VQTGRTSVAVEFGHVVFDAIEVVLEGRLADEVVNCLHDSGRFAGQGFLLHQQQNTSLVPAGTGSELVRVDFRSAAAFYLRNQCDCALCPWFREKRRANRVLIPGSGRVQRPPYPWIAWM